MKGKSASGAKPLSRQRSPWTEVEVESPLPWATPYVRAVGDGWLRALVASEPEIGWHLSISFVDHRGAASRYPKWDEIVDARDQLLPLEFGYVMHLPPAGEYVAVHDTTFHLHQHPVPGS